MSDLFNDISANEFNPTTFLSNIFGWIFWGMFVYILLYTLLSMASLYFIKSYIENNGKPKFEEVKSNILKNIWKFLGLGLLVTIVTVFGMFFLLFTWNLFRYSIVFRNINYGV